MIGLQKAETTTFDIFYDEIDEEIIGEIKENIEKVYRKVRRDFMLPMDAERFEFILCPDVDSFIKYTNKSPETYQSWMVGNADYGRKRLCILSPRVVFDRSREEMMKVVVHEIVHIATDSLINMEEAELWISEGIALLYADQVNVDYIMEADFPKLDSLFGEENFVNNGGYDYAAIYVWYFMEKYGLESLKKVCMGLEQAERYLSPRFEEDAIAAFLKSRQCTDKCN